MRLSWRRVNAERVVGSLRLDARRLDFCYVCMFVLYDNKI